ncbi:hypothetical protein [Saccharopolyspora spinosa]|uniref:hypothetical protein n=1 Tax=Saccharopolyspora spinosa TaxID=60894 RepID=UPI00030CB53C|nr:hypothetical protein [Saccharopolyspora spinosa]
MVSLRFGGKHCASVVSLGAGRADTHIVEQRRQEPGDCGAAWLRRAIAATPA